LTGNRNSLKPAILALIGMAMIWGYNWVVMKESLKFCSPFDFSAIRTFFGSAILFLLLWIQGKPLRPRKFGMTLLLGLLTTTGAAGLSTWALETGGAGKTAVLVYTMPFWVLLMAWPILSERIRGIQWIPILMSLAGLIILLEPGNLDGSPAAEIMAVLAGVSWGGGAIVMKVMRRETQLDLTSVTAWQMLLGSLPLVAIALTASYPPVQWTPYLVGAILYNILFTSAAAFLLWFFVLHELPAGMAGMGTLATPVIGVISASVQLGETPSPGEAGGMLLILSALTILAFVGIRNHRNMNGVNGLNESVKSPVTAD
jgi:drug/metabolite transporter (DMT)-like permease